MNSKKKNIRFKLMDISSKGYSLNLNNVSIANLKSAFFEIRSKLLINSDKEDIVFNLNIIIFESEKRKFQLCKLDLDFIYHVVGLDFKNISISELTLPKEFVTAITNISISTARGILFEKNSNTLLRKFILPPVPLDQVAPKPIFKKLNKVKNN